MLLFLVYLNNALVMPGLDNQFWTYEMDKWLFIMVWIIEQGLESESLAVGWM